MRAEKVKKQLVSGRVNDPIRNELTSLGVQIQTSCLTSILDPHVLGGIYIPGLPITTVEHPLTLRDNPLPGCKSLVDQFNEALSRLHTCQTSSGSILCWEIFLRIPGRNSSPITSTKQRNGTKRSW